MVMWQKQFQEIKVRQERSYQLKILVKVTYLGKAQDKQDEVLKSESWGIPRYRVGIPWCTGQGSARPPSH